MTTHDNENTTNGAGSEPRLEDVTRNQNGQFSTESESVESGFGSDAPDVETAELRQGGAGSIHAMQVSMEQSGAEYINAQKVFLTNSGAKSIEGESSKLTQSGVLQLSTEKAQLHQSSSVFVAAKEVQAEGSAIALGAFEKATLGDGTNVAVMVAGEVEAQGDIKSFLTIGGDVTAGGSVETTMDASTAAVFGAAFGVVFALVWKMIRRG